MTKAVHSAHPFKILSVLFAIAFFVCAGVVISTSHAQDAVRFDNYDWEVDPRTGVEIAVSRKDIPFNYVVVGDLSDYSNRLVENLYSLLLDAAGIPVDKKRNAYSTLIVHDSKVFERLRNDPKSFEPLAIPEGALNRFREVAKNDDVVCYFVSFRADHDVVVSVGMLSEKYDDCLVRGLFRSLGVVSENNSMSALIDVCVLYRARRRNIRDRREINRQGPRLAAECVKR